MTDAYILSEEVKSGIDHWLAKYAAEQKQSAVISALTLVQEADGGWLKIEMMDAVADYLDMPKIAVYEVASFYSMLETEPVGRNMVAVCTNISCMLRGAETVVSHLEARLGIKLGETTRDGRITLKMEEECLAGCTGAPMMTVNGHYQENLTPEKIDELWRLFLY